jgi:probable LLM family oxidoreductase
MQIGIDSFVIHESGFNLREPQGAVKRVGQLLDEIQLAEKVGLDVFAIGEHHRPEYVASSPAVLLAAAAAKTSRITLASAVTVLSSDDPIRVYQDFSTIDLISNGRAEIIVGRGSFTESYPLFGYELSQYDLLFAEKLDLLLTVNEQENVYWQGTHRAELTGQGVYPRPARPRLPIRLGVGGSPGSFVRAGILGLPLTVAIIGGDPARFRPYIDRYRQAWLDNGHPESDMNVAVHSIGFVGETDDEAADTFYPSYSEVMSRIGAERGWPPQSRAQYDASRSLTGGLFVGSPESLAAKIRRMDEALGGISRFTLQSDASKVPFERRLRNIELLGEVKRQLIQ